MFHIITLTATSDLLSRTGSQFFYRIVWKYATKKLETWALSVDLCRPALLPGTGMQQKCKSQLPSLSLPSSLSLSLNHHFPLYSTRQAVADSWKKIKIKCSSTYLRYEHLLLQTIPDLVWLELTPFDFNMIILQTLNIMMCDWVFSVLQYSVMLNILK